MLFKGVTAVAVSICLLVIKANFLETVSAHMTALLTEKVNKMGTGLSENRELAVFIDETVVLSGDTEIEEYEWVEEGYCLRVKVQYKEPPENNYRHKEDYFFFINGGKGMADGDGAIQVLHVDYPNKDFDNIGKDRYVWDACDFNAHFEDVTFDGQKDLLIFLGHAGVHGTEIYAAYVLEDGYYRYEPTFEKIPNYFVDEEAQVIRGENTDCAASSSYFVFAYREKKFEQISVETRDRTKY